MKQRKHSRLVTLLYAVLISAAVAVLAACGDPIPVTAPLWQESSTPTPFQPVSATGTVDSQFLLSAPPAVTQAPEGMWNGINFANSSQHISVHVDAPDLTARIDFRPGWPCDYINRSACVGLYVDGSARVLLVTVHSGVGGDGQPFRHVLEGTGWNSAGLPLEQISSNLESLRGAPVTIHQDDTKAEGLRVITALRVPPESVEPYLSRQITETLAEYASSDPAIAEVLDDPLLVIETCGWPHPDEVQPPDAVGSTGSIYLLVIGR